MYIRVLGGACRDIPCIPIDICIYIYIVYTSYIDVYRCFWSGGQDSRCDSRYFMHTNQKIILQNRYLRTFGSVNRNISRLSLIYKRVFILVKKLIKKIHYRREISRLTEL